MIHFVYNLLVHQISRLVLLCHDLNHNETGSSFQVRVSDHLNIAVIDLSKGYVLVVLRVVFFYEFVDEFVWFRVRSLLNTEIFIVEYLLFLIVGKLILKLLSTFFIKHREEQSFIFKIH